MFMTEFTPEQKKKLTRWILGIAAACILLFLGVQNIGAVAGAVGLLTGLVMPLVIGCAFALIFNVPMRFFESLLFRKTKKVFLKKSRRPLAYIISLLLIASILVGIIWLVIPELVAAIKVIVQELIELAVRFGSMSKEELAELPFGNLLLSVDWDELLRNLQEWVKNQSGNLIDMAFGTISSLVGGIFDFFVSFVFSIYILFSKETLKKQATRLARVWLPKSFAEWLIHASEITNANFRNFISGQTLEAVILGTLCMVGMWIFQIPYAPMVGALVGVTALIPVVGGFIGAGIGAFMIVTVEPVKAIIFVVFLVILQQLEGNLIYPKVMGSKVNLPAMWILAAVTIGGGLAGPVGMLLSVPIASSLYVFLREATEKREKALKKQPTKKQTKA